MNPKFTLVSPEELIGTEISVSSNSISSNGPGRKNPLLKYIIVGGILVSVGICAYFIIKDKEAK